MQTELRKVAPVITPGRAIDVQEYNLRCRSLYNPLMQLSRLMIFLLECDSNNTSANVGPRDSRAINQQWSNSVAELKWRFENSNDLPTPSHEFAYKIVLIHQEELARTRNVKIQALLSEIFNTCNHMLSVDSANTSTFLSEYDYKEIMENCDMVSKTIERWIGSGADASNVGLDCPAFERLGEIVPAVNLGYCEMIEPSSSKPAPKLPDVADTDHK